MIQRLLNGIIFSTLALILFNCASGPSTRDSIVSLDRAIQMTAESFEQRMGRFGVNPTQRPIIAVLSIKTMSNDLSTYILNQLSFSLLNGNHFTIVDRQRLDIVRIEENFQLSEAVSDYNAAFIGRKIGAQYVVTGELYDLGNKYSLDIVAIHVESGVRSAHSIIDINKNDRQINIILNRDRSRRSEQEAARERQAKIDAENAKKREWDDFWYGVAQSMEDYNSYVLLPFGAGGIFSDNYSFFINETIGVKASFFPFTTIGFDIAWGYNITGNLDTLYGHASMSAGTIIPVINNRDFKLHIFCSGLIQYGTMVFPGLFGDSITPGIDIGFNFIFIDEVMGILVKYKRLFQKDNKYSDGISVCISFLIPFDD